MNIQKVAVIGAGTMGSGIAQVTATAGFEVGLNDIKDEYLVRARSAIEGSLDRMVKKDKISKNERESILKRITFTTDLEKAVLNADLVVEAVLENIELKKEVFRKLDRLTGAETILASNTSQYSITEIAAEVSGLATSDDIVARIRDFADKLGKEVVVCRDSQGFISTRVLVALRLECYRLLEEGVASKEDIDKTLKLAFGHPMGQFELADFSGLDIEIPIYESLAKVFGDRFRPPQNIGHLVKAGRIGRKSGKGWYDYTK